jgi:hypothetical protein
MTAQDRAREAKILLDRIHRAKGTVYTLGLLMGIIVRMTMSDWQLFDELRIRAERAEQEDKS